VPVYTALRDYKLEISTHLEQLAEVGTAGGEDDAVGLDAAPLAGEGYVHEGLVVPQILEGRGYAALVVVPA